MSDDPVSMLVGSAPGAETVLPLLELDTTLRGAEPGGVTRAQVALALTTVLLAGLLERVPTARRYTERVAANGQKICFDHGALRTIDGPTGGLPRGIAAFARILEPLGYRPAGEYPLPKLRMTGRAFTHRDRPASVPQFFVSELHCDRLGAEAQQAAERVFGGSADPLGAPENALLRTLAKEGRCSLDLARAGLPGLARAFAAQHPPPAIKDYEILRQDSAEAAWIATEGNTFNHATDRVADVTALAEELKAEGWPIKPGVEVSGNGRVIQTAFIADTVRRTFRAADGTLVEREVPGSFYEFITRHVDSASGELDLSFDTANATGIFSVTSGT